MFRRAMLRDAMRKDGFTATNIKHAMRLYDAGDMVEFESYCRDKVAEITVRREKASHKPDRDWCSVEAYL